MAEMSREKAIDYLKWARPQKPYTQDKKNLQTAIDMGIEALNEQRPHGEWIYKNGKYWCSSCGDKAIYHSHFQAPLPHLTNFCPNCGSDNRKKSPCDHCIDDSDCDRCDVPRERR